MAELRQQYLDLLQGYGVDPAGLRNATEAQLRRMLQQTAQGPDIGGEAASGAAAAQQAAQDVIGGTTPVRPLEELLAEAHTLPPVEQERDRFEIPTYGPEGQFPGISDARFDEMLGEQERASTEIPTYGPEGQFPGISDARFNEMLGEPGPPAMSERDRLRTYLKDQMPDKSEQEISSIMESMPPGSGGGPQGEYVVPRTEDSDLPFPEADISSIYDVEPRAHRIRDEVRRPPVSVEPPWKEAAETRARLEPTLRPDRTPMQITGRPTEPEVISFPTVDEPPLPQEAPPGLLSRLGKAVSENPDIALAGMEGIGSLLANIGAARGQRKAEEATGQGMARSNLISALTGGKVRPAVAEEMPEMGLLGRLGQAVGTAGKLGREVSEQRFERGFKEEEMGRKYDVKEAELQRKIAEDARKLRNLIRLEDLDEARIEKWINDNTLGMDRNDIARYKAEVYENLGKGRLALDLKRFEQGKLEFDALLVLKDRGMDVEEAIFKLTEEKQDHLFEYALKEFGLDERRVKAIEKNADTAAERAVSYAEQVGIAAMKARGAQKREVRKMVDGLDNKQLSLMMDPKQGTSRIMLGLNAAYQDFQLDPNSANMNAVFQMYQRLFDPATVREGDLTIQRVGQGMVLSTIAQVERITGGGFVLARSTIENMKEVADRYYASALKASNNKLDNYIDTMVLGEDPMPEDIRQAEALRNYYTAVWNFDPLTPRGGGGAPTGGQTGGQTGVDEADEFLTE